MTMTQDNVYNK